MLSFTGSAEVGWKLKSSAGKKRVALELGGNAACIVDKDAKDLNLIADRIVFGAFYQGGQSCISVQRVYVHEEIYDSLKAKLVERTKKVILRNIHLFLVESWRSFGYGNLFGTIDF
jgi:acyl-CoA reductase-like NAD-dependent aldehyde dehydrogenase